MFNFFKRNRKETNDNNNLPATKEKDKNGRRKCDAGDVGVVASSPIRTPNSSVSVEKNAMNGNDEICAELTPNVVSYAKVLKEYEGVGTGPAIAAIVPATTTTATTPTPRRAAVKPCGHGTTAIMPSVPLAGTKRESTSTPPSPQFEPKKSMKCEKRSTSLALPPDVHRITEIGNDDERKKNLINQETKFQSQLNDLSKQLSIRDAEASKLRFQMEELQRDVFAKSAGMDRLEAELQAAHKESETVRMKIKNLECDLEDFRVKNNQLTSELSSKTENYKTYENEANAKIAELESTINRLRERIESLEHQLINLKKEKEELEKKHAQLLAEREEEHRKLEAIVEQGKEHKEEIEIKWKDDFEKFRTINIMKEQQLLDDFEWKLREVQQSCKKKLDEKDKVIEERLQEAYQEAEKKMKEAEDMMAQADTIKSYELEIEQLRGLTVDQEKAMKELVEQQEQMKGAEDNLKIEAKRLRTMIEMEKENLQHIQRLHHQEIVDKERTLQQTLNQKRTEIAMYWEERMLHECARLKSELEQIHNEEKHFAMETVRREKNDEYNKANIEWENKLRECIKEITALKMQLKEKDEYYREEITRMQTKTDRDIIELRRLMDKIDMMHHDRFEKLVTEHEQELERVNEESEEKIKEIEEQYQQQINVLKNNLEQTKEQIEKESQQKLESLIAQHRSELDTQWENLIHQKSEAVQLVEDEYVIKYKTLEEQFYTQQKSHESREIELLKTIDTLKNELDSKNSTIDDLQNNIETLEGGIQVLNGEIAQQNEQISKIRREADQKIKGLQESASKLQAKHIQEEELLRNKLMNTQKQSQESIDHLQRKCQCLTKLFEEVRQRYERRESRQEDLNIISDLRQVIAEQEKDLACLNEEKRYFQMRLIGLESRLDADSASVDDDAFEDAEQKLSDSSMDDSPPIYYQNVPPNYGGQSTNGGFTIPPTIPECDE